MNLDEIASVLNPIISTARQEKIIIEFNARFSVCWVEERKNDGISPSSSSLHISLKGDDKRFCDPFFVKEFYEKKISKNNITKYELFKNGITLFIGDTSAPLESDFF